MSPEETVSDDLDYELERGYLLADHLEEVLRSQQLKMILSSIIFIVITFGALIALLFQSVDRFDLSREARAITGISTTFGFFFLYQSGSAAYASYLIVARGRRVLRGQVRALSQAKEALEEHSYVA